MRYNTLPSSPRGVPQILKWLVSRPPAHACIVILLAADLAALGDVLTGADVWFGPVYLLVICLAAWTRGLRAGLVAGFGCVGLTYLINGAALYPFAQTDWALNVASRAAAITMIIVIIAGSRSAYIREWWLARTDPLTGAFNRQAFFELGDELAAEGGWRLLIYADLDGLKRINDLHGHTAGDRAIKDFAVAVRRSIRQDDLFARVGGDEFVVFMRVRDRPSAEAVAARAHRAMNNLPGCDGTELRCSVGALIIPPGETKVDPIVRVADTLMYQAKLRGACLQVELAERPEQLSTLGRARKRVRMPHAGSSSTRVPMHDRRGVIVAAGQSPGLDRSPNAG